MGDKSASKISKNLQTVHRNIVGFYQSNDLRSNSPYSPKECPPAKNSFQQKVGVKTLRISNMQSKLSTLNPSSNFDSFESLNNNFKTNFAAVLSTKNSSKPAFSMTQTHFKSPQKDSFQLSQSSLKPVQDLTDPHQPKQAKNPIQLKIQRIIQASSSNVLSASSS